MSALKADFEGAIGELVPINALSQDSRAQILHQSEILQVERGAKIFDEGDEDPWCFYLLTGKVELLSDGQVLRSLEGGTADAAHAMAHLQPRKMSARAQTTVSILRCERSLLEKLAVADINDDFCEVQVAEIDVDETDDWMTRMLQSQLFAKLPASNIHRIFSLFEPCSVEEGEVIVHQGDPGDFYFVLVSGRAEVTRAAAENAPGYRLALIGAGDAFGEEALVAGARRNATVKMLTGGEVVRLSSDDFDELIKQPLLSAVTLDEAYAIEASRNAVWLDVRFPEAHEQHCLPRSINYPLSTLRMHSGKLDEQTPYLVYCENGRQSAVAAFLLAERGFDVHYLRDGLAGYAGGDANASSQEPVSENVDLTLHDDESTEIDQNQSSGPIPRSHQSSEESQSDADVAAATFDAAVGISELKASAAEDKRRRAQAEAAKVAEQQRHEAELKAATEKARQQAEAEKVVEQQRREAELKAATEKARQQAEAEAQKRIADELAKAREQLQQQQAEVEKNLVAEREKLERLAEQAEKEKQQALREREELERARAAAEQQAAEERERQKQRVRDAEQELQRRLREEELKLKESYAWQAEELERLQTQKRAAEEKLEEEKTRVEEHAAKARNQLEQTRQYQQRLKEVERASAEEAEMRELQALELKKRLREELNRKVQTERNELELQLEQNAQELARAQQERDAAEAARVAASTEAKRIVAEFQEAHERKRVQEESELQLERERLETESRRLKLALELAQREKEAAVARQTQIENEIDEMRSEQPAVDAQAQEALEDLTQQAAQAAADVARIEAARIDAQAAAVASAGDLAAHEVHEVQIREQLSTELDDWMKEQDNVENSDIQQSILSNQKAHMDRIKQRAREARDAAKAHDQSLIDELAQTLGGDDS